MNKKLLAVFIVLVLLFTSTFSALHVFAEDEDYEETEDNTTTEDIDTTKDTMNPLGDYKGLVAHWRFEGDLKDSSQFKNDGEAVGGKNGVTFVDGVVNRKGVKLDGKSYISVKDSPSLDLTNEFTFSFWVYKEDMRKKDNMEGGVPYIIKNADPYGDFPYGVYEWWEMTPGITYCDDSGAADVHSQKQVDIQKWTLLTYTYDGSTMKIYKNKELVKSELVSTSLINSSQPLYIGFGHFMTVDNYFKGVLDDMRIYNTAISYSDVETLYDEVAGNIQAKHIINKPNKLVAFYRFENSLLDFSGFKNDGVAIKANNFKYVDGVAGKGIKFSGASYIEVKDSDSLDLDKGFTFGMWVYKDKSSKNQPIFAKYGESHNKKQTSYSLIDWNDGQRLSLSNFDDDGNIAEFSTESSNEMLDGRWFFYTATYNGKDDEDNTDADSNTIKLYINGNLVGTQEFDGDISNSNGPLWIGGTTDSVFFKGIMDEFRIYNYALSPTEVKNLYKMRDSLEVTCASKDIVLGSLKPKQNAQLSVNLLSPPFHTNHIRDLPVSEYKLTNLVVTSVATYSSSNTKVATVSATGQIAAIAKGSTVITVKYGALTKTVSVVVK